MLGSRYTFNKETIEKSRYSQFQNFHNLMQYRVRDILLVSSLYDSFIFEEDGRLYELIRKEYLGLNLSHSPELIQVSSGKEAINIAKHESRFDLIIITQHIDDMSAIQFAQNAKKAGIKIPIVLLGYDNRDMVDLIKHEDTSIFEKVFMWQGDFRIIIGIIKYIEDKYNVAHDTESVGVQVIILIEDSIRFYSSYLPMIYTELLRQSQFLLSEGINISHKFVRMRARPKILLCSNYESAWKYFKKYEQNLLGVISDVDFKKKGIQDENAGLKFANSVKKRYPDIPILLQSNNEYNRNKSYELDCAFLVKKSPTLMEDVSRFMRRNFSFGDFVFRTEEGDEVERAKNLYELEKKLETVPLESLVYHAHRNHFSNWLKARTEFWLANKLRPQKVSEFSTKEELRKNIIKTIHEFRTSRKKGVIVDFDKSTFDKRSTFCRIGGGSIGGKARGLAFVNTLLSNFEVRRRFKDVEILIPSAVVVGSDVFDEFLSLNKLREFAIKSNDDKEIKERFLHSEYFPYSITNGLTQYLEIVNEPIAVRSSSLLEDSQGQPFAGVYDTIMLPNNNADLKVRLRYLLNAIKMVYASTFYNRSKDYIGVTTHRLEEEKMAVVIQKMVGKTYVDKFYPEFSGVAKSVNFYPTSPMVSDDGIVSVALGLGKTIVDGGKSVRFCPKYPHRAIQFLTVEDTLKYSQTEFYALDLSSSYSEADILNDSDLVKYELSVAEKDGILSHVGSTYSAENDVIYDGIGRTGTRLITFSPILKFRTFPLPEIVEFLLEMGSWGMGAPVEIEFAVNMSAEKDGKNEFNILQMRPLVIHGEQEELDLNEHPNEDLICRSDMVLGSGVIENIFDIVYVDINQFERGDSKSVALQIAKFNSELLIAEKKYLLIGVGRWGSLDPWLGIPVTWEQINGAQAIIESNFKEFDVTPSQGTHFFQNLTSFKIGYFTVNSKRGEGFIDWKWLKNQQHIKEDGIVKHIILEKPLTIKIDGQKTNGIIIKPK